MPELQGVCAVRAAVDLGALKPELVLEGLCQLIEQVVGRVGEGAEHEHLPVAGIVRVQGLLGDELPELDELGVALGSHGGRIFEQAPQHGDVEVEVPGDLRDVHVAQVDGYLAACGELLGIVIVVEVAELGPRIVSDARPDVVEPPAQVEAPVEDPLKRDAEAVDAGLHALEDVHAHEVRHRGGAMHLALEVLAPRVPVAHLVLGAPVVANVGEHLVLGEGELGDHVVGLGDWRQLACGVDGRVERQGRASRREGAGIGPVVLRDVLSRARDGEHVEELEVVGVHGIDEALGGALRVVELAPLVEACLRGLGNLSDGGNPVGFRQIRVIALGDELYLVTQVEQLVVDGGCGEHEHLRADAGLNHVLDEARVAVLLLGVRALVAEVVRLIDHDEIVVAPAEVLQVDVSAHPMVAGQVGVVQHIEGEAIVRERVAIVVGAGPERPVLAQSLGAQHEHAAVALLVVLDHRERLVGLSEADAVRDDAALVLLELADGANYRIPLEVVELVPDDGLLELETRADGVVLAVLHEVAEEVVEREGVHELGRVLAVQGSSLVDDLGGNVLDELRVAPDAVEHGLEAHGLGTRLKMAHPGDDAWLPLVTQALEAEGVCCAAHEGVVLRPRVLDVVASGGGDHSTALVGLERRALAGPLGALAGEGALVQVVAQRQLEARSADALLA